MTESKIACRHPVYAKNISLRHSEMSRTSKINFQQIKKNSMSKIRNPKISRRDYVQKSNTQINLKI